MKEDQHNEGILDKPRRGRWYVKLRIYELEDRCWEEE